MSSEIVVADPMVLSHRGTKMTEDERIIRIQHNHTSIISKAEDMLRHAVDAGYDLEMLKLEKPKKFENYIVTSTGLSKTHMHRYMRAYRRYMEIPEENRDGCFDNETIDSFSMKASYKVNRQKAVDKPSIFTPKPEPVQFTKLTREEAVQKAESYRVSAVMALNMAFDELKKQDSVEQSVLDLVGEIYEYCESKVDKVVSTQ